MWSFYTGGLYIQLTGSIMKSILLYKKSSLYTNGLQSRFDSVIAI